MAVKLDHYQTIVNVHWPDDGTHYYIITSAAFSASINQFVQSGGADGNDGIPYPLVPASHSPQFTTSAVFDYWGNVFTGFGAFLKFNYFDVYDSDGELVESIDSTQASATISGVPGTMTLGEFESLLSLSPENVGWDSVGVDDVDALFPGYKTGSAILHFTNVQEFTGGKSRYWNGVGDRNNWFEYAPISQDLTNKGSFDVTPTSVIYDGDTYLPIGVKLTVPEGVGTDYIQAQVLFRKVEA